MKKVLLIPDSVLQKLEVEAKTLKEVPLDIKRQWATKELTIPEFVDLINSTDIKDTFCHLIEVESDVDYYSSPKVLHSIYAFELDNKHYIVSHRHTINEAEDRVACLVGICTNNIDLIDFDFESNQEEVGRFTIPYLVEHNATFYKLTEIQKSN